MNKERLSKVLARAGVASRRACETLIFEGQVTVNGKTVLVPQTAVSLECDELRVDGKRINSAETAVYYILNKPTGYLCSSRRPAPRTKLTLDLFPNSKRLFTVGRLDRSTSGLLLVTNDGHFANRIIHPSANIEKEYLVKTDHFLTEEHLNKIAKGTYVQGAFVRPASVKKVRKNTAKIVVKEGRKHEVRELVKAADLKVTELKRIRIGNLRLGSLPDGHFRELSLEELENSIKSQ